MSFTEKEAIDWIHSRLKFGSRPGLDRVEAILSALGNPEKKIRMIHIAGTNGKGSTVSYLKHMLMQTGLTVGTFTSPYIERFNERIVINQQMIQSEHLADLAWRLKSVVEKLDTDSHLSGATEFEIITAMGFLYFYEQQVDVAIIEVGLGGLLDSTNVITPDLVGITTIGLDHQDILGETIEEIAFQKAGIIKDKVPVVCGNIEISAMNIIEQIAKEKQAPIYSYQKDYSVTYLRPDIKWGERFNYTDDDGEMKNLFTPLFGRHQIENAGMAIFLFKKYCEFLGLPLQDKWIIKGLKATFWPARMERVSQQPLIILDGAHNDHAMARLVKNLDEFKNVNKYVLFSALQTKDIDSMLSMLLEMPRTKIVISSFEHPKSIQMTEHFEQLVSDKLSVVSLWQFGLAEILENMQEEDMLLITGSLYFVSQVRELLLEQA